MKTDAEVIEEAKSSVEWVRTAVFHKHNAGFGDILWEKSQKHRLEISDILEEIEKSKKPTQEQLTRLCILNHYIHNIKWHLEHD